MKYYELAVGMHNLGRDFVEREEEKYIQEYLSGELDPKEVVREFESRPEMRSFFANLEDSIRYSVAKDILSRREPFRLGLEED